MSEDEIGTTQTEYIDGAETSHPFGGTCNNSYDFQLSARSSGRPYDTTYGTAATLDDVSTLDCPLPTAPMPTNVQVDIPTVNSLTVSWGQVDGAPGIAKYKLERRLEPIDSSGWTDVKPAGITPDTRTSTSYTDDKLSCSKKYRYRVSAYGDNATYAEVYSDPAPSVDGEPGATRLCTPEVTVMPLSQRRAEVVWVNDTFATGGYVLQVKDPSLTSAVWSNLTPNSRGGQYYFVLNLDGILPIILPNKGLAHYPSYEFRVLAKSTDSSLNSKYTYFTVRDTPIVVVDGHSPGAGQAKVTWDTPGLSGISKIILRWRKVKGTHTNADWQLVDTHLPAYSSTDRTEVFSTDQAYTDQEYTIDGLDQNAIYAIQLNIETLGTTGFGTHYSGRDAYVWVSGHQPGAAPGADFDMRVAGYPFFGHHASNTYTYRICTETFPSGDRADWAMLIEDALMRWQSATNDLVMVDPEHAASHTSANPKYDPCTDFTSILQLTSLASRVEADVESSEIRMMDLEGAEKLGSVGEMYLDPFKACVFGAAACVTSLTAFDRFDRGASVELPSADITFNKRNVMYTRGGNPLAIATPTSVSFGKCIDGTTPSSYDNGGKFFIYATVVHEAGHALGVGGWTIRNLPRPAIVALKVILALINTVAHLYISPQLIEGGLAAGYQAAHPGTVDSVMNYDIRAAGAGYDEPDCAPHPLDIMVIHAIYQSLPKPSSSP